MDSDKVEARKSLLESFLKVRYLLVCPCELESSAQDSSVLIVENIRSIPPALYMIKGKLTHKRPKATSFHAAIVCSP